ncbi:hypothetical protein PSTG_01218 [Puccinia striiformis f. sp. tritici PST-78]|uniref:Uncharacterized protein n=1 Tax=Puccinia striiformis f. sp. tritici PST-78 TaxID=1165861 RepID=A0A0L0W2T6_9BASI|nr:hypothetical protein PSTG_01218 [Puccinia striiformis f. sp. tritici PST-78]
MCLDCLLPRDSITNLEYTTWPKRTLADHHLWATRYYHSQTTNARKDLLSDHGARYSALLKLKYWNIIEYHVVDSMHNLLLGLCQWHCHRFWFMSDKAHKKEDLDTSNAEPHSTSSNLAAKDTNQEPSLALLANLQIDDPGDVPFNKTEAEDGWDGDWTPPSDDIIFDSQALSYINKMIPCLQIPTWIERAIPVLGPGKSIVWEIEGRQMAESFHYSTSLNLAVVLEELFS